jgi:hypothetical protein
MFTESKNIQIKLKPIIHGRQYIAWGKQLRVFLEPWRDIFDKKIPDDVQSA